MSFWTKEKEGGGVWDFKGEIGNSQVERKKILLGNLEAMEQREEFSRTGFCTGPSYLPYFIQISLR